MQASKTIWIFLAILIAVITSILFATLLIDPQSAYQAKVFEEIVPVALDLLKIIIGAVVGSLGTAMSFNRNEENSKDKTKVSEKTA